MSANSEAAVLGGLLQNPEFLDRLELTPADFANARNRTVYGVILGMAEAGKPIGVLSVSEALGGGKASQYCANLALQAAGDPKNIPAYAEQILQDARIARAKTIASDLVAKLDREGFVAVDDALTQLMALAATRRQYDWSMQQTVKDGLALVDEACNREGKVKITTGLTDLDTSIGGWHESDLCVIGARPAIGKTALLLNLALACNVPCGIISAEQPHEQIGMRFLALRGRVSLHDMRIGVVNPDAFDRLSATSTELAQLPIRIYDRSGPSLSEVVSKARQWRHQYGIRALFIDYLQRIRAPGQRRHEQVGLVASTLKDLGRDLNIPVIALSQVRRDVEERANKRPGMGDLSDSSEIEKEADTIMTLYRDEVYHEDTEDRGIAEVAVVKNRHGPTGLIKTCWQGEFLRFQDLAFKTAYQAA